MRGLFAALVSDGGSAFWKGDGGVGWGMIAQEGGGL